MCTPILCGKCHQDTLSKSAVTISAPIHHLRASARVINLDAWLQFQTQVEMRYFSRKNKDCKESCVLHPLQPRTTRASSPIMRLTSSHREISEISAPLVARPCAEACQIHRSCPFATLSMQWQSFTQERNKCAIAVTIAFQDRGDAHALPFLHGNFPICYHWLNILQAQP